MTISATDVKELRAKTNAGMMDCKKALQEAGGNMEEAVEILRKKGLALAQKKAGRNAKEGILGHFYDGKRAGLVEINCETDFVVKTADFRQFVQKITDIVKTKAPRNLEFLLKETYDKNNSVQAALTALVAKIGENIQLSDFVRWEAADQETIGFYLHAGSKIGVLVKVADPDGKVTQGAAKELGMHIAAMQPQYIRTDEIDAAFIQKEKEILQAGIDSKKPPEIQDRIIAGKLNKTLQEICLEDQIFVKDPEGKTRVKEWLKSLSPNAKITAFLRRQVGA